jgi:hypothetical protein
VLALHASTRVAPPPAAVAVTPVGTDGATDEGEGVGVVPAIFSAIGAADADNVPLVPVRVTASLPDVAEAPTCMVTVAVVALAEVTFAVPEQVTSFNVSLQLNVTVPVKPNAGVTVTVEEALPPAATDAGVAAAADSW